MELHFQTAASVRDVSTSGKLGGEEGEGGLLKHPVYRVVLLVGFPSSQLRSTHPFLSSPSPSTRSHEATHTGLRLATFATYLHMDESRMRMPKRAN